MCLHHLTPQIGSIDKVTKNDLLLMITGSLPRRKKPFMPYEMTLIKICNHFKVPLDDLNFAFK